jgi:ankyrin repeat protein
MFAVGNGHTACARLLIEAGAALDCKNNVRSVFGSPIFVAVLVGAYSFLAELPILAFFFVRSFHSPSPNGPCHSFQRGRTALIWAAANGHVECARLLLDAGVDKNAATNVRISLSKFDLYHYRIGFRQQLGITERKKQIMLFHLLNTEWLDGADGDLS